MELLWEADEPKSVADVHAVVTAERELAYTTIMTVLDRLAKKSLVDRELVNRAWQYTPKSPQSDVIASEMGALLNGVAPDVRLKALRRLAETLTRDEREALTA